MSRTHTVRFSILTAIMFAAVAAVTVACGGSESSNNFLEEATGPQGPRGEAGQAGLPGQPGLDALSVGQASSAATTLTTGGTSKSSEPPAAPYVGSGGAAEDGDVLFDDVSSRPSTASPLDLQIQQISNERIIVRTVDMSVEVLDTNDAIQQIGNLATQSGGWVVRTQHVEVHRGSIDIRVPSDQLDAVIAQIRNLSDNVVSEISTSQDFTEEFTDTTARIQTMQDTVDALRALFEHAEDIEDALQIQQEITRIQADIEAMQARVNFLSQSAAFSLLRITVLALPQDMEIDAGGDILAAAGRTVRLRAEFTPPEGIDEFNIEWDFGDGSVPRTVGTVAPVNVEGRVISAPIVHVYNDDTDSPYIVKVTVKGTGESGAAEGEDVLVVTVNRVPPIEVFAGENRTVDAGKQITLRGSFTRPEGVEDLSYTWDFGDGSAPVTVDAAPDVTVAEIGHIYANSRPQAYDVVLTVEGETAAGSTEGTGSMRVLVTDPPSLNAGFSPGDNSRDAVRTLSAIGSGIGLVLIWAGILSPIWLVAGAVVFVIWHRQNRLNTRRTSQTTAAESRQAPPASDA